MSRVRGFRIKYTRGLVPGSCGPTLTKIIYNILATAAALDHADALQFSMPFRVECGVDVGSSERQAGVNLAVVLGDKLCWGSLLDILNSNGVMFAMCWGARFVVTGLSNPYHISIK